MAANEIDADGTSATATVEAFKLGMCQGKLEYQAVEWYFPQYGQSFDPNQYMNICTGTYVGETTEPSTTAVPSASFSEVVQTIHQKEVAAIRLSINSGEGKRRAKSGGRRIAGGVLARADRDYTWSQREKLGEIPSVQRQVVHLPRRNHSAEIGTGYVQLG